MLSFHEDFTFCLLNSSQNVAQHLALLKVLGEALGQISLMIELSSLEFNLNISVLDDLSLRRFSNSLAILSSITSSL